MPNPGSPTFESGAPKLTQLNRLNATPRNSRVNFSRIGTRIGEREVDRLLPGRTSRQTASQIPEIRGLGIMTFSCTRNSFLSDVPRKSPERVSGASLTSGSEDQPAAMG